MVVEDRGAAPADGVGRAEQGGQPHRFRRQDAVEPPPQPVEDLPEILGRRKRSETAGESRVEVVVEVDQPRQNHPAVRIHRFRRRVFFAKRGG